MFRSDMFRALIFCLSLAAPVQACQTALILSMDVSNSVDPGEFRLQTEGLALALQDPEIMEILVRDRVKLSVIQWSGFDKQEISLDWEQMLSPAHVIGFAARAQRLERAFVLSDTAPGDALSVALDHFESVPDCARWVVDMSGDGTPNAGIDVRQQRQRAESMGVTVNALAIESLGIAITNFYSRHVITPDGFVMTARGHRDYARAIRAKILREISQVLG